MCVSFFRNKTVVEQECIAATLSYRSKLYLDPSSVNYMYRMVTSCFQDNTNLTLAANCEHPDTDALSENIPVTSQITGYTYWNKPCAVCNDDDDDIIEWTPNVLIRTSIPYFSNFSMPFHQPFPDTYEKLSALLNSRRFSDTIYTPPVSIMPENQMCIRRQLVRPSNCEQTLKEEDLSTTDWLFESCRQFFSPIQYGFRGVVYLNIFCLVCRNSMQLIANKPTCRSVGPLKASPGYLTGLLNYKLEPDDTAADEDDQLIDEEKCNCAEMFDPYLVGRMCLCVMTNPAFCTAKNKRADQQRYQAG